MEYTSKWWTIQSCNTGLGLHLLLLTLWNWAVQLVISKCESPHLNESLQYLALAVVTRRLYCVEWHNTVFAWSGQLSVHKLFTSCIRRCLVMSALSATLLIFIFQFSLLFFHISVTRQHQHCGILLVLICNIGHRMLQKSWVGTFPVRSVQSSPGQRLNWF